MATTKPGEQEVVKHASLFEALVAAQFEFPVIPKNSKAEIPTKSGGKYVIRYADLADVKEAIRPILFKHGLAVLQFPSHDGQGRSTLITYLIHESGEKLAHPMLLVGEGPDPKTQGTAITYARRYALGGALGLVTDDDVDAGAGVDRSAYAGPYSDPEPEPPKVDPEEQARQEAVEAVFKQATDLKKADGDGKGKQINNVLNAARADLNLANDEMVSAQKLRQWIGMDVEAARSLIVLNADALKALKPDAH